MVLENRIDRLDNFIFEELLCIFYFFKKRGVKYYYILIR